MEKLSILLKQRKEALMKVIEYAEKRIPHMACGRLRIMKHYGTNQYFHVVEKEVSQGIYIPNSNLQLAKNLAQKAYLEKLLRAAQAEVRAIDQILKQDTFGKAEEVYTNLPSARKALVTPLLMDDAEYAKRWQAEIFEPNPYEPENRRYATKRGEYVRSKTEAMIADSYYDMGIPYKCDYPVQVGPSRYRYMDFVLLDVKHRKEIYHEHFGLLDDPQYLMDNLHKLSEYKNTGIFVGKNLILTHDLKDSPLDMNLFRKCIAEIFGIDQ